MSIGLNARATPEEDFWKWFGDHEEQLFNFERDQTKVFDQLSQAMKKVSLELTFEFGPKRGDGKREFVISAGGLKSAFPKVESLFSSAPKLRQWIWVKFRPRRSPVNDVELNGKTIKAAETRCVLVTDSDPKKVGILVLLPGYRKDDLDYKQLGYLLLDESLGEYDVEMRIGGIDSEYASDSHPLSELAKNFDQFFARR